MRIALLGPVEVVADGGVVLSIPSRRQRQLLIALALNNNAIVPVDTLTELIWGDQLPADPGGTVQTTVSRLRRLLPDAAEIVTHPTGYKLSCPPDSLDTDLFHTSVARMRGSAAADRLELGTQALALWRGEPFPELAHPDVEAERQRFIELRLEAIEAHTSALCEIGRYTEAIEILETFQRQHPEREGAVASLMTALYATGRQSDALEAFGRLRNHLLDELGVDPSAALRELEVSILRQELEVAPPLVRPPQEPGATPTPDSASSVESPASSLDQHIRFCSATDGVRIAFATSGSGPVLVKAANWISHLDYDWESPVWRHWLQSLSSEHTLIRYDERGSGLSDWNVERFSFDSWVEDLEVVVDVLGLEQFPLLGISQGGAVAIDYAVRHPERVTKLILCGAYPQGRLVRAKTEEAKREAALNMELARLGWGSDDPTFRQVFTSHFMPDSTKTQWDEFNELQRRTTSPENAARFMGVFNEIDVSDIAHKVECPALILHSRDELRVPLESARELAALIPNSRLVPLPSKNHLLARDEPAWPQFLAEVNKFLLEV